MYVTFSMKVRPRKDKNNTESINRELFTMIILKNVFESIFLVFVSTN